MSENENPVENTEEKATQESQQAGFKMEKVFVKDLSFESPNSPLIFTKEWKPRMKMDLNTKAELIEEDVHEVSVRITLTVAVEEVTAFIVEVQQAGIFTIKGLEGIQLQHVIGAACPNLLFPYLRETIDSTVVKGGFQPLMLAPVNFDAMFAQAMAQQQQQAQDAAAAEAAESTVQ